jgi:thymidylate synthase
LLSFYKMKGTDVEVISREIIFEISVLIWVIVKRSLDMAKAFVFNSFGFILFASFYLI